LIYTISLPLKIGTNKRNPFQQGLLFRKQIFFRRYAILIASTSISESGNDKKAAGAYPINPWISGYSITHRLP
jgi:hypothetical protein